MMENTAMRLLAIFMFCSLFSIKTSKGMEGTTGEAASDDFSFDIGSLYGEEPSAEITTPEAEPVGDVVVPEKAPTIEDTGAISPGEEEVPTEEPLSFEGETTTPVVEEGKKSEMAVTTPTKEAKKVQAKKVDKKVTRVRGRGKVAPSKSGLSRKEAALKAGAKPSKTPQRARREKGVENEIEKLAKFDESGEPESFNKAVDGIISFMAGKKMLPAEQKTELYAALAKFQFILGKEGFSDEAHYDAVIKVLTAAIENGTIFSKYQIKIIERWKKETEKQKANPELRKKLARPATKRKQAKKRDIGPVTGPQRKAPLPGRAR